MSAFTYRTFNPSSTDYERALADALYTIMARRIYAPDAIAGELNKVEFKSANGKIWTGALLEAELQRLGSWTNCIGGPVGSHTLPGASERMKP